MEKKPYTYFEHSGYQWPTNPEPWIECSATSFEDVLENLKEDWHVYDCDGSHDRVYFVAICDGTEKRYYKIRHEFYASRDYIEETGESEFTVENFFEEEQITKEEAHIPDDRDWLDIGQYNYKLPKWPPKDNAVDKA